MISNNKFQVATFCIAPKSARRGPRPTAFSKAELATHLCSESASCGGKCHSSIVQEVSLLNVDAQTSQTQIHLHVFE